MGSLCFPEKRWKKKSSPTEKKKFLVCLKTCEPVCICTTPSQKPLQMLWQPYFIDSTKPLVGNQSLPSVDLNCSLYPRCLPSNLVQFWAGERGAAICQALSQITEYCLFCIDSNQQGTRDTVLGFTLRVVTDVGWFLMSGGQKKSKILLLFAIFSDRFLFQTDCYNAQANETKLTKSDISTFFKTIEKCSINLFAVTIGLFSPWFIEKLNNASFSIQT